MALASLGHGAFVWEYDVLWLCGGTCFQLLFIPNIGPYFVAYVAACQMHEVSALVRFSVPLAVYLASAWMQWWIIALPFSRLVRRT